MTTTTPITEPSEQAIKDQKHMLMKAFGGVLAAEQKVRETDKTLKDETAKLEMAHRQAQNDLLVAWGAVEELLTETGEFEVILPGQATDYKISKTTPRESIDVPDVNAVPPEFTKTEIKAKLKEIGDFLKEQRDLKCPMPNWATFKYGESKWQWKPVKKAADQ